MTTRRERQAQYNTQLILEAAARVLVRSGYEGLTIEAIATEADYSPAALYKYFKGKADIFRKLIEFIHDAFFEILERPAPAPATLRAELLRLVERAVQFAIERRELFEALLLHAPRADAEVSGGLRESAIAQEMRFLHLLVGMMKRGIESGELRPGSAEDYAWALRGLLHSFLWRWCFCSTGAERKLPGVAEQETLLELFLSGAGPRGADMEARGA